MAPVHICVEQSHSGDADRKFLRGLHFGLGQFLDAAFFDGADFGGGLIVWGSGAIGGRDGGGRFRGPQRGQLLSQGAKLFGHGLIILLEPIEARQNFAHFRRILSVCCSARQDQRRQRCETIPKSMASHRPELQFLPHEGG